MFHRKSWKTLLSLSLVLCLLCTLGGVSAFAAEDQTEPLEIQAFGGKTETAEVGNITVDDPELEWVYGINASASEEGSSLTVTAGDITVSGGEKANWVDGMDVNANDGGALTVTAGNITTTGGKDDSGAVYGGAYGEGSTLTVVVGDIDFAAVNSNGVMISADNGTADITTGSITASGEGSSGVGLYAENGSVSLTANGDVSGTDAGALLILDAGAEITLVVDGTLSGSEAAIRLDRNNPVYVEPVPVDGVLGSPVDGVLGSPADGASESPAEGTASITVWKLESEGESLVSTGFVDPIEKGYIDTTGMSEEELAELKEMIAQEKAKAEALEAETEAAINYIIRVENPEAGVLSGTTQVAGFDTAKEGQTVTVKAAAGYTLVGVTNNGTALLQDADGNFVLVVPKGGGVSLKLLLEEIKAAKAAAVGKIIVGQAEAKTADGHDLEIIFYDDGAYKLTIDGKYVYRGHSVVEDGALVLVNSHGVKSPVQDDSSIKLMLGREDDESYVEFKLDKELVSSLIELLS